MAEWVVQIGRFDIRYAVTSINRFSAAPWEGHLKRLVSTFGYLQNVSGKRKIVVVLLEDIGDISGQGDNTKYWLEKYPSVTEEIDEGLPEPRGRPLSTTAYNNSEHAHDKVTRRSVSGVMSFVRSTPIRWTSKRQGTT